MTLIVGMTLEYFFQICPKFSNGLFDRFQKNNTQSIIMWIKRQTSITLNSSRQSQIKLHN